MLLRGWWSNFNVSIQKFLLRILWWTYVRLPYTFGPFFFFPQRNAFTYVLTWGYKFGTNLQTLVEARAGNFHFSERDHCTWIYMRSRIILPWDKWWEKPIIYWPYRMISSHLFTVATSLLASALYLIFIFVGYLYFDVWRFFSNGGISSATHDNDLSLLRSKFLGIFIVDLFNFVIIISARCCFSATRFPDSLKFCWSHSNSSDGLKIWRGYGPL